MPWVPGYQQYYNERVPADKVHALAMEYMDYSVSSAARYPEPYPNAGVSYDVWSDSMYVIPRLQNYADPLNEYYQSVLDMKGAQGNSVDYKPNSVSA
jgi:hypothetical protein